MWSTGDRIIRFDTTYVRSSAVIALELKPSEKGVSLLLSSGDRVHVPLREGETAKTIAGLIWAAAKVE